MLLLLLMRCEMTSVVMRCCAQVDAPTTASRRAVWWRVTAAWRGVRRAGRVPVALR